jgi:cytochrome c-type biogenesis protein CcmH
MTPAQPEPAAHDGSRRWPVAGLVLAVALIAAAGALTIVLARGAPPPSSMQDRIRAVASQLRCPVCQDLSVADSPSALAGEMRGKIATELRAGTAPDAIRAEFIDSYGDWILMSPPRHGISLVAWILPALLLLGGVLLAVASVSRWTRGGPDTSAGAHAGGAGGSSEELAPADRRLLERALAAHGEEDQ